MRHRADTRHRHGGSILMASSTSGASTSILTNPTGPGGQVVEAPAERGHLEVLAASVSEGSPRVDSGTREHRDSHCRLAGLVAQGNRQHDHVARCRAGQPPSDAEVSGLLAEHHAALPPYRSAMQSGIAPIASAAGRPVVATAAGGLRPGHAGPGTLSCSVQ
jgi:hypothetical protein